MYVGREKERKRVRESEREREYRKYERKKESNPLSTLSNSMYDDNDNETIIEKEFFSIPIFSYPRNSEIALKFNCEQIAQFR